MAINASKTIIILCLMLLAAGAFLPLVHADQAAAVAAIALAKEQIVNCYRAAEEAEAAGANITALVAALNEAGLLLSRAEYAYSIGDFDVARDLAVQVQSVLGGFVSEAKALKEAAVVLRNQDFLINVIGSCIGAFAILGGGVLVWVFLKRRYGKVGAGVN